MFGLRFGANVLGFTWGDGEAPRGLGGPGQLDPGTGRGLAGEEMPSGVAPCRRGAGLPHKARRVGEPRGSEEGSPLLLLLLRWAEEQGSGVLG